MDLTTRALLLFGVIFGLFAIAGVALVIGKSIVSDNSGESFDIGKKRRKPKKPKKSKESKKDRQVRESIATSEMQDGIAPGFGRMRSPAPPALTPAKVAPSPVVAEALADEMPQHAPRLAMGEAPPSPPPAPTSPLESIPTLPPAKSGGAVPFGGAAQPDGEW